MYKALLHVRICKFYWFSWNLLQGDQTMNKRHLHRLFHICLFNNSTSNETWLSTKWKQERNTKTSRQLYMYIGNKTQSSARFAWVRRWHVVTCDQNMRENNDRSVFASNSLLPEHGSHFGIRKMKSLSSFYTKFQSVQVMRELNRVFCKSQTYRSIKLWAV